MTIYRTEYDTRLLYTQSYMADESMHVTTDMHAVMWTYPGAASPTTTRVRLTFIYNKEAKGISPVQGLLEQWKSEGWSVMDEYCDGYLDFESVDDFRAHLLEMTRSFLLGVPFGAEVEGDISPGPKKPPPNKEVRIPKMPGFTSRIDKIIKKSDEKPSAVKSPDEDDIYASSGKSTKEDIKPVVKNEDVKDPNDEDDDDDWI